MKQNTGKIHYQHAFMYSGMSIRKILTPVTGKPDVLDVLMKSLKVDLDLPVAAQTQAVDISAHVDDLTKRLRPELLEELFAAIEAGALAPALGGTLVSEVLAILDSGLQELEKEEARFTSITRRVEDAYRRAVEVQSPLADFLGQRVGPQGGDLAERINELKRFRESLSAQKSNLDRLGEKITLVKQKLVKLKDQGLRLSSRPQAAQAPQQSQSENPVPT